MTTSAAQICANRLNAKKSRGPISRIGKAKVATNAIKHGLSAKSLILSDENPIEYQTLLEQLQSELQPVGILEQSLVERIAVALWRQKRLIRAETAYIESERTLTKILADVKQELDLSYTDKALTEDDLTEFNPDYYQWCKAILSESKLISFEMMFDPNLLSQSVPNIYQYLLDVSQTKKLTPEEYLNRSNQDNKFFMLLAASCQRQIERAEQRSIILAVAEQVRSKKAILKERMRDSLSRYQVILDNDLYKAIKALREAQEWRY